MPGTPVCSHATAGLKFKQHCSLAPVFGTLTSTAVSVLLDRGMAQDMEGMQVPTEVLHGSVKQDPRSYIPIFIPGDA